MKEIFLTALFSTFSLASYAQVTVTDPWVRATVPAQKATGAFMQLNSETDTRLVAVSSPVARAEIHEMAMKDNVMRMRQIAALDVPAGKTFALKPGSYHLMFFDLKNPIREGDVVPLTLVFEDKDKKRETLELKMPARALNNKAAPAAKELSGH